MEPATTAKINLDFLSFKSFYRYFVTATKIGQKHEAQRLEGPLSVTGSQLTVLMSSCLKGTPERVQQWENQE